MEVISQHLDSHGHEVVNVSYCMRSRHTGRLIRVLGYQDMPGSSFHLRYELLDDDAHLPVYTRDTVEELIRLVTMDPKDRVGTYKRPRTVRLTLESLEDVDILERQIIEAYAPVQQ
jgi:hypothetical protein